MIDLANIYILQPTSNNIDGQSHQRQTRNIDNNKNNNKTVDKQSDNLNLLSKLLKVL